LSIVFPYEKKLSFFGEVADPKIPLKVYTKEGYREFRFLVDTGADATLLPRYAAEYIGVDLGESEQMWVKGIEGVGLEAYAGKIRVRIGDKELEVRCLFAASDRVPFILGRTDIFDHFNLIFDNQKQRLCLEPLTGP